MPYFKDVLEVGLIAARPRLGKAHVADAPATSLSFSPATLESVFQVETSWSARNRSSSVDEMDCLPTRYTVGSRRMRNDSVLREHLHTSHHDPGKKGRSQ